MAETLPSETPISADEQKRRLKATGIVLRNIDADHGVWEGDRLQIKLHNDSAPIRAAFVAALNGVVTESEIDFVPAVKKNPNSNLDLGTMLQDLEESDGVPSQPVVDWGERKRGPAFDNPTTSDTAEMNTAETPPDFNVVNPE